MDSDLTLDHLPPPPARSDFGIGVVGAGFIVRDIQLVAYHNAGFKVLGITSRSAETAHKVAALRGIPGVYESVAAMLENPNIEIIDIAIPPDRQLEVIRRIAAAPRKPKGILAQKPLAMNYAQAVEIVRISREAGIRLAVNQNMRFDHSIYALKNLLARGWLGEPVLATIEMRAVPHWQPWLHKHQRLTLLNMSVHHLDSFRYLFGDPDGVYTSARRDPRTKFPHQDGICLYILEYDSGFRASAWDDVWTGPRTQSNDLDPYIKWRVEGTEGLAEGSIGWPGYPNHTPSRLRYSTSRQPGIWISPQWMEAWFPDAFSAPMAALMDAIAAGRDPGNSGDDNVRTMALVDACYRSLEQKRLVRLSEVTSNSGSTST